MKIVATIIDEGKGVGLLEAYRTHAWGIAIFHLLLLITCTILWLFDYLRLKREQTAYHKLPSDNLDGFITQRTESSKQSGSEPEVYKLTLLALSMVKQGQLPNAETIRLRLLRSIAVFEPLIRTCLNAFIISGLLGTLYNLWQLGPTFWEGLIQGKSASGYPSIGIAFSASVYGLTYALALTFIDSLLIRLPRDIFIRKASSGLYDAAARLLPPTEGAAVADALRSFHNTSTGFLREFKDRHEEIARQFSAQVQSSSDELVRTLNGVGANWEALANNTTTQINTVGNHLALEVQALTGTTSETKQVLSNSLDRLREAVQINSSLAELRMQIETLLSTISSQLSSFNNQWREDLRDLSQIHVQRLEAASTTGWARYEKDAAEWHEKNVEALTQFAGGLQTSIAQWSEERNQVGGLIDNLVESWRRELGQNVTAMQSGLAQLREQVVLLQQASNQLTNSNNSAIQQLGALQNAVNGISNNIVNGTPIGAAIQDMTQVVSELRAFIGSYMSSTNMGGGAALGTSELSGLRSLIEQILKALETLPTKMEMRTRKNAGNESGDGDIVGIVEGDKTSEPRYQSSNGISFEDGVNDSPSFWKRLWPFKRRRKP